MMRRLMGWVVPDRIAPTELDTIILAFQVALMRLPIVLDRALRKALLAPTQSDFEDMATAEERAVIDAFMQAAKR